MADETVADVLREVCDDECWKMIDLVEMPEMAQPEMDYEDWAQPLKLTGGRVCLQVSHDWFTGFVTVDHGDRLVYRMGGKSPFTVYGVEAVATFQLALDAGLAIEPVLREETPFGEVADD